MSVYVDKLRDWGWGLGPSCHMIADTNEELHARALKIGLKLAWFQVKLDPHYDLTKTKRELAIKFGAIQLEDKEFHSILRKWRSKARSWLKRSKE